MSGSQGSIIQEWLVSLGVQVNVREFYDSLGHIEKAVAKFVVGIGEIAEGMREALVRTAEALENLYFVAQRAGTTVQSLRAMEFGMRSIGLSADTAQSALEGLAMAIRINPGNESLLRHLGVQTRDMAGGMRDTSAVMGDFLQRLSKMPFYIAAQYAAMFGVNANTLYMLLRNFREMQQRAVEWRHLAQQTGVDLDQAARKSHLFMNALRTTGEIIDLLWFKVAGVLIGRLQPEIQKFNAFLLAHSKEITKFAEDIGNAVLTAGDDIIALLPTIDRLVQATIGWKGVLEGVADIIAYRIFGPLGLAVMLTYQVMKFLEQYSKDHKLADPKTDRKTFNQQNKEMTQDFLNWLKGNPVTGPFYQLYERGQQQRDENEEALRRQLDLGQPDRRMPSADDWAREDRYYKKSSFEVEVNPNSGRVPLGVRNNNPGNLRSWEGAGQAGGFAQFRSAAEGLSAMRDNLLSYARHGLDTVASILRRWAPGSENNTGAYIGYLSRFMGVRPGEQLNMQDPAVLSKLMQGIARYEQGYLPYSPRSFDTAANGGRSVIVHQNNKTDIHVHGSDPHATGQAVKREQQEVAANMVRRFRTAVIA